MKEYYYEDLEALSQTAREVWLAEQCSIFESELRKLTHKLERENFIEELYKKLKQVTRRWQSWNRRSFGGVTSRGYVTELHSWECNIKARGILLPKPQAASPDISALEQFEEWCQTLEELHKKISNGIFNPLKDFFLYAKISGKLKTVPKDLEKVLSVWHQLLTSGVINEKILSSTSGEAVYPMSIRNRCHDFDLVLRLIPDLTDKAYEALRLARRWRLIYRSSALLQRDDTYVVPKDLDKSQRRRQSKIFQMVKTLEYELEQSQAHYKALKDELEQSNAKCEAIEKELSNYRQQCNHLENELDSVKKRCENLKHKLDTAKRESKTSHGDLESSSEYIKVLQQELNSSKMKYCVQKIKFINAKRRCSLLTKELDSMKEKLITLAAELEESKKKCQALKVQLENTRKNVFTQGNMLDVLQNQCFTLKDELDGTKVKCVELSYELEKSRERCKSLVEELELVKDQCHDLNTELCRAKTREELLIKQNEQLRSICQEKGWEEPILTTLRKDTSYKPDFV